MNLRAELESLRVHDRLDAIERERLQEIVVQQARIIALLDAQSGASSRA